MELPYKLTDEYTLVEQIGRGGMAVVYRGIKHGGGFQKPVIIKLPRPGFSEPLILEGVIGSQITHPNIRGTIYLGGTIDHPLFLVLEYVDGWSLARVLQLARRAGLTIPTTVAALVVHDMCEGLAHLHQTRGYRGTTDGVGYCGRIVHRDLKPGNVLISREGAVKLIDFGMLSSATPEPADEDDPHTADAGESAPTPGRINGTPRYMTPEQAGACNGGVSTRTDLFAAGLILYEMLTGEQANQGRGDTETIRKARQGVGLIHWDRVFGRSRSLARIYGRATRWATSQRYETAEVMRDELAVHMSMDRAELLSFLAQIQALDEQDKAARAKTDPTAERPQPSE